MNYLSPIQRVSDIRKLVRGIWRVDADNRVAGKRPGFWDSREITGLSAGQTNWRSKEFKGAGVPKYILTWGGTYNRYWDNLFVDPPVFIARTGNRQPSLYKSGSLFSNIPTGVIAGACVRRRSDGFDWVIVVNSGGEFYRTKVDQPESWELFATESLAAGGNCWRFNQSGTAATKVEEAGTRSQNAQQPGLFVQSLTLSDSGSVTVDSGTEQPAGFATYTNEPGTSTQTRETVTGDRGVQIVTITEEISIPGGNDLIIASDYRNNQKQELKFKYSRAKSEVQKTNPDGEGTTSRYWVESQSIQLVLGTTIVWSVIKQDTVDRTSTDTNRVGDKIEETDFKFDMIDADVGRGLAIFRVVTTYINQTLGYDGNSYFVEGENYRQFDNYVYDGQLRLISEDRQDLFNRDNASNFLNTSSRFKLVRSETTRPDSESTSEISGGVNQSNVRVPMSEDNWAIDQYSGDVVATLRFPDRFSFGSLTEPVEYTTGGDTHLTVFGKNSTATTYKTL